MTGPPSALRLTKDASRDATDGRLVMEASSVGLRCNFRTIPPRCLPRWTSGVRVRGVDGLAASNSGPSHRLSKHVSGEAPMFAASTYTRIPPILPVTERMAGYCAVSTSPTSAQRSDSVVQAGRRVRALHIGKPYQTQYSRRVPTYRRRYMPWSHAPSADSQ